MSTTSDMQAAIDAATHRGVELRVPPGVHVVTNLILRSGAHLRGSGQTIIMQAPGSSGPMIATEGFDALAGSDSSDGPSRFSLREITLDGNRANNVGNNVVSIYGVSWDMRDVTITNGSGVGLYSEYGFPALAGSPPRDLSAMLDGVRVIECESNAIDWRGPHDSHWSNLVATCHTSNAAANVKVSGNGFGLDATNCHLWGLGAAATLHLDAGGCSFIGGQIEGADDYQLLITQGGQRVFGTHIYGRWDYPSIGVQVGLPDGNPIQSCMIDARLSDCGTAWVGFGADVGGNVLRFATGGAASASDTLGTKAAGTVLEMVKPPNG